MRKHFFAVLFISLAFLTCNSAFFSTCNAAEKKKPKVLKAVSSMPVDFVAWATMHLHKEEVERLSNGQLKINIMGGVEVIPQQEQIHAVGKGVVDINYNAGADVSHVVPLADCMPLTEMTPWEERKRGLWDLYRDVFAKQSNTYYLGNSITPMWFRMGTRKPVKNLAEAKGLKVRATSGTLASWKAIGLNGVLIGDMDLYTALDRGVIDTLSYPSIGWKQFGWTKLVKYIVGPRYGMAGNGCFLVNLDTWKSLTKEEQTWLTQPFIDKGELWYGYTHWLYSGELWGEDSFRKAGIPFIEWPEEDNKLFKKLWWEVMYKKNVGRLKPDIAERFAKLLGKPLPKDMK